MRAKIICLVGAVLLAIFSVLTVVLFADDLAFSLGVLAYYMLCLAFLIRVDFKFKPYEWLMFFTGIFVISMMLIYNVLVLYTLIPLTVVLLIMLIIRICQKKSFGRIILMIIVEILCGVFIIAVDVVYEQEKAIEEVCFQQKIVSDVCEYSEGALIKFENSDIRYKIDTEKGNLLQTGDTVYVKIYNGDIHRIKRNH